MLRHTFARGASRTWAYGLAALLGLACMAITLPAGGGQDTRGVASSGVRAARESLPASRDDAWQGVIRWRTGASVSTRKDAAQIAAVIEGDLARGRRHFIVHFDRPVGPALRGQVESAGMRLLGYLGDNAFFATVTPGRLNVGTLFETDGLMDVQAIEQGWKLHPILARGEVPAWTVVDSDAVGNPIVAMYVVLHRDVELDAEAARLGPSHGAVIRSRLRTINALVVELPYAAIAALADEDVVQWIEPALPPLTATNDSNRQITQADEIQAPPYELDGSGITALVYDVGNVDPNHPDFAGRLIRGDEAGVHEHPTHVAGTAGGDGAASGGLYRGMAPGVSLVSYAIGGELTGVPLYTDPLDIECDYREAIQMFGVDLATNSIGTNTCANGFDCELTGDYGVTASLIDAIVGGQLGEPLIVVWANGNERGCARCRNEGVHTPEGYHSTAPPACAKNHITVGALNSDDDSVTSFTSWGPTDDGRLKPDIAAPGCQTNDDEGVTSCVPGGGYDAHCGTSMATPTVAGLTALLLEDLRNRIPDLPRPLNSTVKVLLAHNAVDLGNPGPDYQSGYGSVRIRDTIDFARTGGFFEDQVDQGETYAFLARVDPNDVQLKVTLAWDDVPATPNVDPTLVNDLDLLVYDPSSTRCFPWTLDPDDPGAPAVRTQADRINNIEQVLVDTPTPGMWTVYVSGFNVPEGPRRFSICGSPHLSRDCDGNGVPDDEEILADPSLDCTGNGILDICEPDCNGNGMADSCDIADGTSVDCDDNGVPDECQPDCNENGVADACDIRDGTSEDCDADGVPDECQDTSADCNGNGVWDACDIAEGTSADENHNGVPDECEGNRTIYVDDDGPFDPAPGDPLISDPDEDGSPEHPYDAIQEAIGAAIDGDVIVLADGHYAGWPNVNLDFSGKAVDLHSASGPENCVVDCEGVYRGLFFHSGETPATRVEGLTIRGGYEFFWGGAVFCEGSSPTLANCVFDNAWAILGAAIYVRGGSPTLSDCVFIDNWAVYGAAGFVTLESNPTFAACTFRRNTALTQGGALKLQSAGVTRVIDCVFLDNEVTGGDGSPGQGGAVFTVTDPVLTGCIFSGNVCSGEGGAVYARPSARPTLTNCILWGNSPDEIFAAGGTETTAVSYSNVQGGWPGLGNITINPLFVDLPGDDLHLSSGSPCINTGSNYAPDLRDVDIEGNPRIQHCRVDMGAYESPYPPAVFEDCNSNGEDDACDIYNGTSSDCNENHVPDECDLDDGTGADCQPNGVLDECDIADGTSADCNENEIPDECDIADGTSEDYDLDGVPDECQDCNGNGVPDACDLACSVGDCASHPAGCGGSDDYDLNGLPDDCDPDCNGNGVPDACDLDCSVGNCADHPLGCGGSEDCNGNQIADECDITGGTSEDCNGNGVPDECDIADGASDDYDLNDVPDECDPDCNANGVPDICDLDCSVGNCADHPLGCGGSEDYDDNGIPDECLDPEDDCNENGILDERDIADGTSEDCNGNGIPDECIWLEDDCNANEVPDECDIADGASEDCNGNNTPDECDLADGTSADCNGNEVPDECDLAQGTSADCNGNGIPDECDIDDGTSADCNGNGVPDDCDLAEETSADCNDNGIPDECDIADGTSDDYDLNGVADECEDCTGNGVPNACDINCATGECAAHPLGCGGSEDYDLNGVPDECEDCNENGIPDACDIDCAPGDCAAHPLGCGASADCNGNDIPDECDFADGTSRDCNANGIPDECDIADGTSEDADDNGVPDECQLFIYVDDDASNDPGPGDPTISDPLEDGTPEHPYDAIQEAIDAAYIGDDITVMDGVYSGAGNRNISVRSGISLHSLNGPQGCIIELEGFGTGFSLYNHENQDSSIVGFTIQNGGRGIRCSHSNPTIRNCVIRGHVYEDSYAGGINCWYAGPTISHCVIEDNYSINGPGGGINIFNGEGRHVTIANCIIANNTAEEEGGGVYIRCDDDVVTIRDCLVIGNQAAYMGGGIYCRSLDNGSGVTVKQCTIIDNVALPGYSDRSYGGGLCVSGSNPQPRSISNCIIWGNSATDSPQISVSSSTPAERVAYCDIQDFDNTGDAFYQIINADPLFVDPTNGDYHLSSDSPCFNAGDPNYVPADGETDIDDQPRLYDGRIDIGADEFYPFTDCNHNGIPDDEDIAESTSSDCNGNQVPDECEGRDCNGNNVLDECDISAGGSLDCNFNGIPDECERDCNDNGIPDDCDIADGTSFDENDNGVPDECDYVPCVMYVDDNAPGDPGPGDPEVSDSEEDGSPDHPFDAVQKAIDASSSGDEIVVRDGLYTGVGNRNINFRGNRIYLHSENGPQACVIDCEYSGIGLRFSLYETPEARLEGITIQNGWSNGNGSGIACWSSSPTIRNCVIQYGISTYGGAVYLSNSDAQMYNCRITDNDGSRSGYGAITCGSGSSPRIANCLLARNVSTWHGGVGCYHGSTPTIINCTIVDNTARYNSGGITCYESSPIVHNCIIWGNDAPSGLPVYLERASHPTVDYSALQGELPAAVFDGGHNIYLDPRVLDADAGHLAQHSPCVDAGDPNFVPTDGETDIDGQPRVLNGRVDIGADEYDHVDCNNNGVSDAEDIADGFSPDCDANGVPDECQLGGSVDCNENGVPDLCDIFSGASVDCNLNAIPDECEPGGDQDCDDDGVSDLCAIHTGSPDINVNGVPDECEPHVTIHVDDNGPYDPGPGDPEASDPDENGTPEHPYDAIQEALDAAPTGAAEIVTVLVADGVYTGVGNRDLDYLGKVLTLRSENGPETCIIDCQQEGRGFYFHNDETPASVLEGFTVRNGVGEYGGGIYCAGSTPSISRCIITDNSVTDWAGNGGGIYFWSHGHDPLIIRDCDITNNTAQREGGGIACSSGTCVILNCVIAGNRCADSASFGGGGMFGGHDSIITISDSVITGNATVDPHGSDHSGGGGIVGEGSMLTVNNCTITLNSCGTNGGSGVFNNIYCNTVIRNSIIWGNLPVESEIGFHSPNPPAISYCDITEGFPVGAIDGGGNIDADPLFVDWDGPDDDPNTWQDNDFRLLAGSPCIDAADNTAVPRDIADLDGDGDTRERTPLDLDGKPRFVQDPYTEDTGVPDPPYYRYIVDMGPYEFQFCLGDLDDDDDVDSADLMELLSAYGETSGMTYHDGDLDGDGDVDLADLAELLGVYGTTCE